MAAATRATRAAAHRAAPRAARSARARRSTARRCAPRAVETPPTSTDVVDEDLDSLDFSNLEAAAGAGSGVDNKGGSGEVFASPDWLTQLQRNWGGKSDLPLADAKVDDIQLLLGGGLFQPLYKWMIEEGPVYLLPTGPVSSFVVVSDPEALRYVLQGYGRLNNKGTIAEVGGGENGAFGDGFALLEGQKWKLRRKAVAPGIHRKYIETMVGKTMVPCAEVLAGKLGATADVGKSINLEDQLSQVTLDVIGKAAFNYEFNSLTTENPLVQAVYTALKESETRAMDLVPIYKLPGPVARAVSERQRVAWDAISLIRRSVEELVTKSKGILEAEARGEDDLNDPLFVDDRDPSLLRFLLASREETSANQLRDDLVSILIAGHETTGAVLTWLSYMLMQNPECMAELQAELDEVLGDRATPTYEDIPNLRYTRRCIDETMRLYPQPPVYTRRAVIEQELPTSSGKTFKIPAQQDMLLSIYNMHRSPDVWGDDAGEFKPMRFGPLDQPPPNEANTNYRYIPFSAGPRKCPGDQFALQEAVVVAATIFKQFDISMVPGQTIGMTSGATIHTSEGLMVNVKRR